MNYIEITKAELVVGGNVVRQGDHFTQGYIPRDYKGDKVSLTGKTITAAIYSKKGVHYEGSATFDATTGVLSVTVRENIGSGTMWVEFTATDPANATYKQKFPANEFDTKLEVVRGIDDLDFFGASPTTVNKLRGEHQALQQAYEVEVDGKIETFIVESDELKAGFNAAMGALTQDSEVVVARGGEQTLGVRLDKTTAQLADIATYGPTEFESNLNSAVTERRKISLTNEYMSQFVNNPIIVDKAFTLIGAGKHASILQYTGSGAFFDVTASIDKVKLADFQSRYTGTDENSVGFYFRDVLQYSMPDLTNLFMRDFKKAGIIVKRSYNGTFRDLEISGRSTAFTRLGILLGEEIGDWINITTIENSILTYCADGVKLNNGVKVNLLGLSLNLCGNGISLDHTGDNDTRDISIVGCYFEANEYGIYAKGDNVVKTVTIKDNFFSDKQGIYLRNVEGLTFQDNSYFGNLGRSPKTVLDKIADLKIIGFNHLNFTTPTNKPILLTGESKFKENIVPAPALLGDQWGKSQVAVTNSNTNTDGVERNFKTLPSAVIPSGTAIAELYSPSIVNGTGSDVSNFVNGRLFGARCVVKVKGNTAPVKVEIGYINSGTPSLISGRSVDSEFVDIQTSHIIDSQTINTTTLQFAIRITKNQPSDNVTVYFDDIQGWTDYLNPPVNPNGSPAYSQFRRPSVIENIDDVTHRAVRGQYFNAGDSMRLTSGVVKTASNSGFNYNGVPDWAASTAYKEGDFVKETNALLRCIKAGTSGTTAPKNASGTHSNRRAETDNTCIWLCVSNTVSSVTFV